MTAGAVNAYDLPAEASRLAAATGYEVLPDAYDVGYFSRINGEPRPPCWLGRHYDAIKAGWYQAEHELRAEEADAIAATTRAIRKRFERPVLNPLE